MGDKYIIELEDKPFHKEDGDFLYRAKGFKSLVFGMTGIGMLTPYTEPDLEQVRKEAYEEGYKTAKIQCGIQAEKDMREVGKRHYQRGLSDAWDAARKIVDCVIPYEALENYLEIGECTADVIKHLPASKAIEVVRQYEDKQKEIKVGDEVTLKCGVGPAIYMKSTKGSDEIYLLFKDGSCGPHNKSEIERKTGRHFPEIAAVIEKMRGEQDG